MFRSPVWKTFVHFRKKKKKNQSRTCCTVQHNSEKSGGTRVLQWELCWKSTLRWIKNGCVRILVMERQWMFRLRNRTLTELHETNCAKITKMLWDKAAFTELCRQRCVCPVCLIQAVFSASYQPVMFIPVLLTPLSCLWHCIFCLFIPSRISFTCLAFFFNSSGIYINSPFAFTSSLFSYITSPPSDHFLSFLYNHASASKLTFLPYRTCEPIVPLSSASLLYSIFSIWPQRLVLINVYVFLMISSCLTLYMNSK